jgi:predicted permease
MATRWLTRLVLAVYPPTLRQLYGDELAASLGQAWRRAAAGRGPLGPPVALVRLIADLWRSWRGSCAERRWLAAHDAGAPGPGGPRFARSVARDAAYALRAFRGARGFYAGVLLTLALGIGANAAVFSLVRAVVLQPLPYANQDELVMVWQTWAVEREFWRHHVTPRFLLGWREHAGDVATLAAVEGVGSLEAQMDLETPARLERLDGAFATPNFFEVLGTSAVHGRVFTSAEESAASRPIVISHRLWRRVFNADPGVVGRDIVLTMGVGKTRQPLPYTIIGVLPDRFRFTYPEEVEVWTIRSWADIEASELDHIRFQVVGRLLPGVTLAQAQVRFAALQEVIRPGSAAAPIDSRRTTRVEPVHDWVVDDAGRIMTLLSAVAGLLLVITCATTANALFIRVSERRRELALRTALGASRGRVLRQLVTEGAVLAATGTAAGLGLAIAMLPALRALVPPTVPRGDEIGVDAAIFLFAAGAVVVVTILAALLPAWRGAGQGVSEALKRSAASVSADRVTSRWRRALVAAQAAMAAALLVTSALLLLSFWRILHEPLGFEAGDLLAVEMRVIGPDRSDGARLRALQADVVARVRALPGVADVAATSAVPFRGVDWRTNVEVDEAGRTVGTQLRQVDPEYFRLLGIRPTRGRLLTHDDVPGAPDVAVVSASLAREAFGTLDVIGRTIGVKPTLTIVGVVPDVRYSTFQAVPALAKAYYVARAQRPSELLCLLVEPRPGARDLAGAIRQAVREVDPSLPAMGITSVDSIIDGTLADRRFYTAAVLAFAALALVLTVAGLVIVVVRALVERRKELAIRLALGATSARVQRRVLWEGLDPVAIGVGVGLLLAALGATWLSPFLFAVEPRSGALYLLVGGVLLAVAGAVGWLAARRAASLMPSAVLRE